MAEKNILAKNLADMVKSVAGSEIAERMKESVAKAREANAAAGVDVALADATVAGVDFEVKRKSEMRGLVGSIVRAAAKSLSEDGTKLVSSNFEMALKAFAQTPDMVKLYKAHHKKLSAADGAGYTRQKALGETTFVDGGAVVPPAFVEEIIEYLRPNVVVRALGAFVAPMPRGTMTFPYALTGIVGSNTVENAVSSITQPTFGNFQMTAKKIRAVVPISNDLLADASPQADLFIQKDMAAELRRLEDFNFLRGSGNNGQMKGLRNQAQTALTARNAANTAGSSTVSEVILDLVSFPSNIESNNILIENGGYVWAPRTKWALMQLRDGLGNFYFKEEMLQGRLFGYRFGSTTTQPINLDTTSGQLSGKETEILFADFDRIIIGDTQELIITPYQGGAYWDNTLSTIVSGISADQTVVVGQMRSDIAARYRGFEIANMTKVTWGA